jgi:hypothetical protein
MPSPPSAGPRKGRPQRCGVVRAIESGGAGRRLSDGRHRRRR